MKKLLTIEVVQEGTAPAIGQIHNSGDLDVSDWALLAATAQITLMNGISAIDHKSGSDGRLVDSVTRIVDAVFEGRLPSYTGEIAQLREDQPRPTGDN